MARRLGGTTADLAWELGAELWLKRYTNYVRPTCFSVSNRKIELHLDFLLSFIPRTFYRREGKDWNWREIRKAIKAQGIIDRAIRNDVEARALAVEVKKAGNAIKVPKL